LGVIAKEERRIDKKIEGRRKDNVNKLIERSSFVFFWKREDGKDVRGADNMMLGENRNPCEFYKKGSVFELRGKNGDNTNRTLVPRKCEMCHKKKGVNNLEELEVC